MKEKRCRISIEDKIWKKSLCPYVLEHKWKVSKVHNRYLAHWGLPWLGQVKRIWCFWWKWWAVLCLSSSTGAGSMGVTVHCTPYRAHDWEPATLRKTQPFWHCVLAQDFSLRRIWDEIRILILSGFHLEVKMAGTPWPWFAGDVKNQWCHLPFHCTVACWLSPAALLCNRNQWLVFNQSNLWRTECKKGCLWWNHPPLQCCLTLHLVQPLHFINLKGNDSVSWIRASSLKRNKAAGLLSVMHVCEGVSEVQLCVLCAAPQQEQCCVPAPAAAPGAPGSRLAAVRRAGSAALCWGEKAVLETWCRGSAFVAVTTSQAYLVRKLLNAEASCQHDTLSYFHASDLQSAAYGSLWNSAHLWECSAWWMMDEE